MGADDWVDQALPPRGGAGARGGRGAAAEAEPPAGGGHGAADGRRPGESRADQFQAFVRASSVDLTRREFEVLRLLAQAKGKVSARGDLPTVWGYPMAHGDRSVDVFVRKVRQKLEKASPTGTTSTPTSGWATASSRNGVVTETSIRSRRRSRGTLQSARSAPSSSPARSRPRPYDALGFRGPAAAAARS